MLRLPTHHLCSCLAVPPRSSALHCSHGICVAWLSPLVATRSVSVATAKHCTANPAAPPSHLLRSAFYWSRPSGTLKLAPANVQRMLGTPPRTPGRRQSECPARPRNRQANTKRKRCRCSAGRGECLAKIDREHTPKEHRLSLRW